MDDKTGIRSTFKECVLDNMYFWVLTSIAVILLITSFLLPPTGEISPSTLQAVAEIFAFASLGTIIKAIDKGKAVELKHGNTSISVRKKDDEDVDDVVEQLNEE